MSGLPPVDVRRALGLPDDVLMADTFAFSVDMDEHQDRATILQEVRKGMERFKPHAADIGLVGLSMLISSAQIPAPEKKQLMTAASELICTADMAGF